ncbi:hypothetical protein B6D60_02245 [candidate division KSB1 bacterium 4484_87]|nr:MAG: hypothetical protein B6D60_02245 [candidate division KSB1 bacterium 4484_87]
MKNSRKNKYLIFIIASWLAARLKITFELSRLALFRAKPGAEVRFVIQRHHLLRHSEWCWDHNRVSVIKFNDTQEKIIIHQFPVISGN